MEKIRSKSWVGNIYHKFEAVCREVDEFVTKDTVKEAPAVNGKPKYSIGTYTSTATGTTQNPIKEQSCLNQYADNSVESHNTSISTELDGVVAYVGNECATATYKNLHKVFKVNVTKEEALVDEESSTLEDRILSESCSDKESKDTMCYSFSDDDKCFSDASSSQIILQDDVVREEKPLAEGSSASKNDKMFDCSPDDINCISNVPSSQMVLQQNITREVQPVTDQSNSFGDMTLSVPLEESHGNSIMTKFSDAVESISDVSITQTNLQDNITSEDRLAYKETTSARDKSLYQTSAFASDIPPTSPNDAGLGVSMTMHNSFLDNVTYVSEKSKSSSLSTSSIGNCMQEVESDFSISTGLSYFLPTPLVSAKNIVDVVPALSNAASFTDFSDFSSADVNASSSHESVGNAGSIQNDLERCPSPQLKVLICPAETGCMNDRSFALPSMETIDLTDKGKLKESCVLVDNKLHNHVSFRPRKFKSYKEAFASRKRLIKEYKQLAVLYADVDVETSQHVELSQFPSLPSPCLHSTESSTCNICESEWELL
ncbi:hypothetical protein RND71_037917 [Anisodus tanguticus]|uniref:Uncharacterized protein n=1 Tax=Anisodus tanguticus TaxID=243964 RepID=A0AAE1UWI4_9SOLA|nr:hypothetical protein RND71_037917 [Anisodus tanguticus]